MKSEPLQNKIWRSAYPVLIHVAIYILVLFGADILFSVTGCAGADTNAALNRYAGMITTVALVIAIPILYSFFKRDHAVYDKRFIKDAKSIAFMMILGICASHGLSLLISLFAQEGAAQSYQEIENVIYANSPVLVIIRTVILAPLCEELIFRGLMFRRIKEYTNFWIGAIISSIIFSVYHLNLLQGIFAFILGLILCLAYEKTRNLWAAVFLHAAGNLISVILSYSQMEYPSMTIYIIVMIILLLITAFFCYKLFNKKTYGYANE